MKLVKTRIYTQIVLHKHSYNQYYKHITIIIYNKFNFSKLCNKTSKLIHIYIKHKTYNFNEYMYNLCFVICISLIIQ